MVPCGEPHEPLPTPQCAQAQPGRCQSYSLTSPKASLVHRFTETETHEIDGFFRQARRESAAVLKYGKVLQRSMAEKDAISCLGFSETVY